MRCPRLEAILQKGHSSEQCHLFCMRRDEHDAMRGQATIDIGDKESILFGDDRQSIEKHLDDLIERMSVEERNEARSIEDAKSRTIAWYDRLHRSYYGVPLTREQAGELTVFLNDVAADSVRKWNARQLAEALHLIDDDIGSSGLTGQEREILRAEVRDLRGDLERSPRYRPEHDAQLASMIRLIGNAPVAWAEKNMLRLEPFLGRHRWWL